MGNISNVLLLGKTLFKYLINEVRARCLHHQRDYCLCLYILIKILCKINQNKQNTIVCSMIMDKIELSTITNPNKKMFTGQVIVKRGLHKGWLWSNPNISYLGKPTITTTVPINTYNRLIINDVSLILFFILNTGLVKLVGSVVA